MEETEENLAPGPYYVDTDGIHRRINPGTYTINQNGGLSSAVNFQSAVDKIKWEEAHTLLEKWGQRGTKERTVNIIGMYALVTIIIVAASYLALKGIVEGQALVGFLGAAIGYLLSRGEIGLR